MDEISHIPMYDDLYLDVTVLFGKINILDEEELLEAYQNKKFDAEKSQPIYDVKDKLIVEIKNHTNK